MEIVFTKSAPMPIGPYSQAVFVGNLLYSSGQIAVDNLNDSIEIQTKAVCENINEILKAKGLLLSDVVKTTCFLKDMSDFSKFNETYAQYFSHNPARSCVAVKELPKGALVEIEVIAEKGDYNE
ncbi:MAG: Rid family detoxifying hydrolase [Eubacteriales bacterium]|nr:Rid family detoxifying hydrolase [Eubacteriales bacterium]